MKIASQPNIKLLLVLLIKHQDKGFGLPATLFSVLVVFVLFAMMYLPCLQGPVGKTRETEGRNAVGSIIRYQQSFHSENQIFATQIGELELRLPEEYYRYEMESTPTSVFIQSIAKNFQDDGIRSFSGGLIFDEKTQQYSGITCQSNMITEKIPKPNLTNGKLSCPEESTIIQ